jgi:hypothetical protein
VGVLRAHIVFLRFVTTISPRTSLSILLSRTNPILDTLPGVVREEDVARFLACSFAENAVLGFTIERRGGGSVAPPGVFADCPSLRSRDPSHTFVHTASQATNVALYEDIPVDGDAPVTSAKPRKMCQSHAVSD